MKGGIHTEGDMGIVNLCKSFDIPIELILVPDYLSAFELIERNEADVAVVNTLFGNTFGGDFDINRTQIIFNPISIKYAFPKNSDKSEFLIARIDETLSRYKDDSGSVYYQLLDTYLQDRVEEDKVIPLWLILVLMCITFLLLVKLENPPALQVVMS